MKSTPLGGLWPRLAVLIGVAIFVVMLAVELNRLYRQRAAVQAQIHSQQAIFKEVRKVGGKIQGIIVAQQLFEPQAVDGVDLADTTADRQLLERLSGLSTIRRLNLDGTNIQGGDLDALIRLPNLQLLSLARTRIGDSDVASLARLPKLRTLSLRSTPIGDSGVKNLAGMASLSSLDISQTLLTADGLMLLQGLPALQSVTLDERCITRESVRCLQSIKTLQSIELCVPSGLGKETRELLSGNTTVRVAACGKTGQQLWDPLTPWDETLAGVVEAVVAEVALDSDESLRLVEALGDTQFNRRQPFRLNVGQSKEEMGEEITSCEDFIRALHTTARPQKNVQMFARDKFTKTDVPKLLQALRALSDYRDAEYLQRYGSLLLAHHGLDDPEVVQELDRMLNHDDPKVRGIAIHAFSEWNNRQFNDKWIPSAKLAEFAVPRLLRCSEDENISVRLNVTEVLGDLTFHHPKYAPQVMLPLIKIFKAGDRGYGQRSISRIAEVNKDAALAVLPELRRLLANAESEVPASYLTPNWSRGVAVRSYRAVLLEAICSIARFDPTMASETATVQLKMIVNGETDGRTLVTLVSPSNPEAVRTIVRGLLDIAGNDDLKIARTARATLVLVAIEIRDSRTVHP